LLHSLEDPPNFIGITETWLKPHNATLFSIDGYSHKFLTRPSKAGGGVSLFIKDSINYKVRLDLNLFDSSIEMLWVEVEGQELDLKKNFSSALFTVRLGQASPTSILSFP
jgi:hypothetical protein